MKISKINSYAKINLALNINSKKNSLHKIESIISFIDLYDVITINHSKNDTHIISFYGRFSNNIGKKNTVEKLFKILDEKNLLNGKKFNVRIKKNIPQKSGLGGGSMNAANILNYLINMKLIKITQRKLEDICNLIGSDVILGINFSNCVLSSNNKIKKFYDCPKYFVLLVKPDFGCSTKKIYSKVTKFTKPKFISSKKKMFYPKFLINQSNALQEIVFKSYPKIKKIASFLSETNNPIFVRMTGSGSTIIAYFNSLKNCNLAKNRFKKKHKNYWCITSKTI